MIWKIVKIFRYSLRRFAILLFSYAVTIMLINKPFQFLSHQWHIDIAKA